MIEAPQPLKCALDLDGNDTTEYRATQEPKKSIQLMPTWTIKFFSVK
jgi:hypothetical protein